ncbi:MAG: hypothetical protein AAF387_12795 [Pseudomonadota bacterium]
MDSELVERLNLETSNAGVSFGTDEYLAARFAGLQLRYPSLCLFAIKATIENIPFDVSDPGVARLKLAWWADRKTNANHPLMKIALELGSPVEELHKALTGLVNGLDKEYTQNPFDNQASINAWFEQTYGGFFELFGPDVALGLCAERVRSVLRMRDQILVHINRVPLSFYQDLNFDQKVLASRQDKLAEKIFFDRLLEESSCALEVAFRERQQEKGLIAIYAQLTHHKLIETIQSGGHLLEEKIELTPLKKLWLAWRLRNRS